MPSVESRATDPQSGSTPLAAVPGAQFGRAPQPQWAARGADENQVQPSALNASQITVPNPCAGAMRGVLCRVIQWVCAGQITLRTHACWSGKGRSMTHATRIARLPGLAVGLGIGAALAATPGVASADDFQISIDGMDLFPTAGNTATATSGMGDFAIAF